MFTAHNVESAPQASRAAMRAVAEASGGTLPDAVARLATSPELLNGFLSLSASFERCTLDPLSREVVIMTIAVRNQCHICVAMHTGKLRKLDADTELIAALREERPLSDERLETIRTFTLAAMATAGAVDDDTLKSLLARGYTERNALEVVMGIGTYTMSTLANRLVKAV
ncbi:carboxymuconolactone decarboxylase family protein [Streptomyces sp. RY43-2]|uniref:Carboxymuconolactone decarboxylase family protein n=1 Tax=Streptomyces macrolidinus TaxID=2952607 RepID=A0ABT0ZCG3_9ACTN|nr:carboxymuconolactone decarboxylase family protein [Streptomyces macrolidinus]MCN9240631.1 carboxymuconolactone decarboxylase family protein [Streptomyces macrolidinus]